MVICEINIQFQERAASIMPETLNFFFCQKKKISST